MMVVPISIFYSIISLPDFLLSGEVTQHHGGSREKWKNILIADQCGVVRAAADRSGSVVKDGRQICDALAIADRSEVQA